jgi:hypothetical protein
VAEFAGRVYAPGVRTRWSQLTTFRLTHEERRVLALLAESLSVSKTDVVREGLALLARREGVARDV